MKKIALSQGKFTKVDDEDYVWLSKFSWNYTQNGYARRSIPTGNPAHRQTTEMLHRRIMNCPKGKEVDHINGDKLDNRKSNLRICSRHENGRNCKVSSRNKSGYKGVIKRINKVITWEASIEIKRKTHYLGRFKTPELAAKAYNEKAKELFGEFALLNKI